jgi:hypothetical protein
MYENDNDLSDIFSDEEGAECGGATATNSHEKSKKGGRRNGRYNGSFKGE